MEVISLSNDSLTACTSLYVRKVLLLHILHSIAPVNLFIFCQYREYEIAFYCDFNLYFPNCEWTDTYFHKISWPCLIYKKWLFMPFTCFPINFFFLLIYWSSIYSLGTDLFQNMIIYVANVFLQNMAYLSSLFLVFSSEWEFIYMCVLCLEIIQICFFLIFTSLYLHFS